MSAPEYDREEGERRSLEGQAEALRAQRVAIWKDTAHIWFRALPQGWRFTSDDLLRVVGVPDEGPNRVNVVGAFIGGLSRAERIRWTGEMRKSERPVRHVGMQRVWVKL